MALTNDLGLIPIGYDVSLPAGFGTNALIDASGEKTAMVGNVWHPTVKTGTIAIRKVLFRTGAVTLNAASEVRVSLQDVSLTAGPVYQPDGTQDQFYDFKTATATLAANAWQSTGNLSADRTIDLAADSGGDSNSRRLAVVWEYQAFNASDSVVISTVLNNNIQLNQVAGAILNTGSWAVLASRYPNIAFECSDGTFAFMQSGGPWSGTGSVSVGNAAAIRRAGVKFSYPTQRSIDRVAMSVRLPNGADGRLVLYDSDGTTELRSITLDNDDYLSAISDAPFELPFEPVTLSASTFYRWAFVSTTATTATINYNDVNSAALMDGLILGQNAHWTQHDGTNWTDTTTRRPLFGIGISAYHSGGGLLVHPGMTGGMRG